MHADRTNRTMLTLLAVILIAAGVLGALTGFKLFGASAQRHTLTGNSVGRYFGAHGDWLWAVIAVAALIVILLALRWLATLLFSTDHAGDLAVPGDKSAGRTTLGASALTGAVSDEVATYPGVHSARARLIGDATNPTLVIGATLERSADLTRLRQRIESGAVAHARQALDAPDLHVQLDLSVTERQAHRVT
jgi:hypothetical protein